MLRTESRLLLQENVSQNMFPLEEISYFQASGTRVCNSNSVYSKMVFIDQTWNDVLLNAMYWLNLGAIHNLRRQKRCWRKKTDFWISLLAQTSFYAAFNDVSADR